MKSSNVKRIISLTIAVVFVFGLSAGTAMSQDAPAKAGDMQAKVVSVTGIAYTKQADNKKAVWTPLKKGQTLDRYALIRTSLGATVVVEFADRGKVTIEGGTKIGISTFESDGKKDGKVTVKLGLKYGSMNLKVDKTRGKNDFSVSTAVATLSVRGTEGKMSFWGDTGLYLFGTEGTFQVAKGKRKSFVKAGQRTDGNLSKSTDMKDEDRNNQMGDSSGGLTKTEKKNLYRYGSGRGIFGFTGNPLNSPTRFIKPQCDSGGMTQVDPPSLRIDEEQ